jgi:hypothetical protein
MNPLPCNHPANLLGSSNSIEKMGDRGCTFGILRRERNAGVRTADRRVKRVVMRVWRWEVRGVRAEERRKEWVVEIRAREGGEREVV